MHIVHCTLLMTGDYIISWLPRNENWRKSNRKDRDLDPIQSPWKIAILISISVTLTVNGLVKLLAFNAHICPSKYLDGGGVGRRWGTEVALYAKGTQPLCIQLLPFLIHDITLQYENLVSTVKTASC